MGLALEVADRMKEGTVFQLSDGTVALHWLLYMC